MRFIVIGGIEWCKMPGPYNVSPLIATRFTANPWGNSSSFIGMSFFWISLKLSTKVFMWRFGISVLLNIPPSYILFYALRIFALRSSGKFQYIFNENFQAVFACYAVSSLLKTFNVSTDGKHSATLPSRFVDRVSTKIQYMPAIMHTVMASSNGNIFRVTDPLCGEVTGPRWIPHTKASDAELWCFLWSASE